MNYLQLLLFVVFVFSNLISGIFVFSRLFEKKDALAENRHVYSAEVLLLGSIFTVGMLVLLSIVGLYKALFLWLIVAINFLFLLDQTTRTNFKDLVFTKPRLAIPDLIFLAILAGFFFRNCYFLVDVDSQELYLFIQKLWLHYHTSIFADKTIDFRIYVPAFDTVPFGLGVALFGQETFFPQLINVLWRIIVLLLVYGYTTYRFHSFYGLAAAMMVMFNDHFFISGMNHSVVINGALIGFIFAASYNFLEARREMSPYRWLLAMVFLSQLMANKYQSAYVMVGLTAVGLLIQDQPLRFLKSVLSNKRGLLIFILAWAMTSLWYIKNYLATGLAIFPIFAGKFGVLGWTPEMEKAFMGVFRGLSLNEVLKYLSYLFIWPGIDPAKYVWLVFCFLPFVFMIAELRNRLDKDRFFELCYWLGLCVLLVAGLCLASHQDPRYYRYPIAVMTFASIAAFHLIFKDCLGIKNPVFLSLVMLALALPSAKIILHGEGGSMQLPSWKTNLGVLTNKVHFQDVVAKHYPQNIIALRAYEQNRQIAEQSAWFIRSHPSNPAPFLLPLRPQIGLWLTTAISWSSYADEGKIIQDLRNYGISHVMKMKEDQLVFESLDEFAKEAVLFNRYPDTIYYPYEMPPELTRTKF